MMRKLLGRIPKNYEGNQPTGRQIRYLLPAVLEEIGIHHKNRPDLVLAAWPEMIGKQLSPMTKAVSLNRGVLLIKVKNSALLSVLAQHEKKRLLALLKEKFPSVEIRDIVFRIG